MRKLNPQIRHHLTDEEKERLRTLATNGRSASAIAREMHITRNVAARWKKDFGLPTKPPLPTKKILPLLGNTDQREIAKLVGFPYRRVQKFAVAHGFGRKPCRELSVNELVSLIGDIRNRRGSAASLARTYRYSYHKTLALAHVVLKCERFLPTWKTPLSSYFPSQSPQPLNQEPHIREATFNLVCAISTRFPDGEMPADSFTFAGRLTEIFMPEIMPQDVRGIRSPSEWLAVRANFAAQVRAAIETLRVSQSSLVN